MDKPVWLAELDQGVYQEGQARGRFHEKHQNCIELHPNKHKKDIGMRGHVILNIVQHDAEACAKNY